jgi:hypothetical protein
MLTKRGLMQRISMNNNRLNLGAALRTAEAGMSVFPVRAQKITGMRLNLSPVYPSGPRTATRSPDKIAGWWDEHIDAIPAIPCTSVVVLDADQDGIAALEALIATRIGLPRLSCSPLMANNTTFCSQIPRWITIRAPFLMELTFADRAVSLLRLVRLCGTALVGEWMRPFRRLRFQNCPSGWSASFARRLFETLVRSGNNERYAEDVEDPHPVAQRVL